MTSIKRITETDRQDLLDGMHEETAQLAVAGYDKLSRLRNAGVLLAIELGCQIDHLTDNESIEDGSLEVTKLATYWGMDNTNRLYEWRNTAAAFCKTTDEITGEIVYDKSFVLEQMRSPMGNGNTLDFEHFKQLGRLTSEKKRLSLLKQTRKNSWSGNQLKAEIAGTSTEKGTTRTGGRKPQVPGSVFQLVQKIYSNGQQLNNFLIASEPTTAAKFTEVPTDKMDDGFVKRIDAAIEQLNYLRSTVDRQVDNLVEGRDYVEQVMKNTANASSDESDQEVMLQTNNAPAVFTEKDDNYITGTAIAAKVREANAPKKKTKAKTKKIRPRKS